MDFSANKLLALLPQSNIASDGKLTPLDEQWCSYYAFYGLGDILNGYRVKIDTLEDAEVCTVFQHFQQPLNAEKEQGSIKGVCVVVHGYMDHVGLYKHLILNRLKQGWDVIAFDLIGHGLSSGERYAIENFSQYTHQLEQVLDYLASNQMSQTSSDNWCLIGQSTGASVVIDQALNKDCRVFYQIKQRVLLAPLLRAHQFYWVKLQYFFLRLFIKQISRDVSVNSHDDDFLTFIWQQDPFTERKIKVSWIGAMLSWEKGFLERSLSNTAISIIQGDNDETVDWRYNLKQLVHKFPKLKQQIVPGAKHHLVNESNAWREQVFQAIDEAGDTPDSGN